jgi:hypothetical protein
MDSMRISDRITSSWAFLRTLLIWSIGMEEEKMNYGRNGFLGGSLDYFSRSPKFALISQFLPIMNVCDIFIHTTIGRNDSILLHSTLSNIWRHLDLKLSFPNLATSWRYCTFHLVYMSSRLNMHCIYLCWYTILQSIYPIILFQI